MSSRLCMVTVLLVVMAGCVSAPDPRPAVVIQAERLMAQGVAAFNADSYQSAAAQFSEAQALFRSMDDRNGVALSHINLAETALAVGQLSQAQEQVDAAGLIADALADADKRQRLELLQARIYFRQGAYDAALGVLEPMLSGTEVPDAKLTTLDLMAVTERTRIAFAQQEGEAALWTRRLAGHLQNHPENALLKARLLRFEAELASRQEDYEQASSRLDAAMVIYKARIYRQGIAATLQEQAVLAGKRGEWVAADELLQRALAIRVWILDREGTQGVLEGLIAANRHLQHSARVAELEQLLGEVSSPDFSAWKQLRRQ